jgi:uncharacterized membrane protein YqhA
VANLIEKMRYLSLIGIISLLLASVAASGWGAMKTAKVVMTIVTTYGQGASIADDLIELVDAFLIAVALFIFAASLYELFIGKLNLPDWMLAHNLYELKSKLSGVIVLVMAVKFLEQVIVWQNAYETLLFGLAIGIVSAVLIALSYFNPKDA